MQGESTPKTGGASEAPDSGKRTTLDERVQELHRNVQELRPLVGHLEERVKKLEVGASAYITKAIPYLSFILATLALVPAIQNVVKSVRAAPGTSVDAGRELEISYNSASQVLGLGFSMAIINDGDRGDFIVGASASLDEPSVPTSDTIQFSLDDFRCSVREAKVLFPWPIPKGQPMQVNCQIVSRLARTSAQRFAAPGSKRLSVTLQGKGDRSLAMAFCFPLTDSIYADLRTSGGTETKTFLNSRCT